MSSLPAVDTHCFPAHEAGVAALYRSVTIPVQVSCLQLVLCRQGVLSTEERKYLYDKASSYLRSLSGKNTGNRALPDIRSSCPSRLPALSRECP